MRHYLKQWAALGLAAIAGPLAPNAQVLPPPDAPEPVQLYVREFQIEGARAFSQAELNAVLAPFRDRTLEAHELEDARRAVTLHYISRGYINSGAVLPDQDPTNGVVRLRVTEGVLADVEVHGNRWLNDRLIHASIKRWSGPPLNLNDLREGLQLLRQNPNIERLNAELLPGPVPGESSLELRVQDRHPFRVAAVLHNHRPPSVGAEQIVIEAADLNLTGNSDALELAYGLANSGASDGWGFSGRDDLEARYSVPLGSRATTLAAHASRASTSIIEEPFDALDIESETVSYGVSLQQPLFETSRREFSISAGFDRRENESWLLSEPFDFAGTGSENGKTSVSVFRLSQEWIERGSSHVLALRSTFNFGIDAFNASDNGIPGDPNGRFFSWLGQAQYVQRLFDTQNRAIVRLAGQWTGERLLALEQMSVGGSHTVRGYRENQLVRDRALLATLEFRIPILFNKAGAGILELAPFTDFGGGWNTNDDQDPNTLGSSGLGLVFLPGKHVEAELFWGHAWREVDAPNDKNAQDYGLHFRLKVSAF